MKVLTIGDPDSEALAMHRLTVTNVRQMFAVDRELLELRKMDPDLETRVAELRRQLDPQGRAGNAAVDLDAKVYEAMPEIAQILQRQKISGREYGLTKMPGFLAAMWDEALPDEFSRPTTAAKWRKTCPPGAEVLEIDAPCPQGRSRRLEEGTGIRRSGPRRHYAMTRLQPDSARSRVRALTL